MEDSESKSTTEAASFESQLAELAEITASLEQGSLGLDESLVRFERGIGLLRNCRSLLEHAERRIELLTGFDASGNPVTRPFDSTATFDQANSVPTAAAAESGGSANEPKIPRRKSTKKTDVGTSSQHNPAGAEPDADGNGPRLF